MLYEPSRSVFVGNLDFNVSENLNCFTTGSWVPFMPALPCSRCLMHLSALCARVLAAVVLCSAGVVLWDVPAAYPHVVGGMQLQQKQLGEWGVGQSAQGTAAQLGDREPVTLGLLAPPWPSAGWWLLLSLRPLTHTHLHYCMCLCWFLTHTECLQASEEDVIGAFSNLELPEELLASSKGQVRRDVCALDKNARCSVCVLSPGCFTHLAVAAATGICLHAWPLTPTSR